MRNRLQTTRLLEAVIKTMVRSLHESTATGSLDTERLIITYEILSNTRMFLVARVKSPDWLEKARTEDENPIAVEQTVDLGNGDEAYLNRMDANFHRKGYGRELMLATLKLLKQMGFTTARGYIEHDNYRSQQMMKKLGAQESEYKQYGSYWTIDLTTL